MAQLVEHLTLDFRLGHDSRVGESRPTLGSVLGMEPAWDSLSPSPSPRPHYACSLFLSHTHKKNLSNLEGTSGPFQSQEESLEL